MRVGDALDNRQPESNTRVVAAYTSGPPLERLGKRGHRLWRQVLTRVLNAEHGGLSVAAGVEPDGAVRRRIVADAVVDKVGRQLQQERVRPDRDRLPAGGLDRDAVLLCQ